MQTDVEKLSDFLRSFGLYAYVIAMLATGLQAFLPYAPFFIIAGANVLVFGLWEGMILTYAMTTAGAVAAFYFSRTVGREWVQRKLKRYKKVDKLNRNLADNGFFYVLMARLAFIVPSIAVNWISGLSRMKAGHFILATLIGKLPVVVLESMIGHDLIYFTENKGRLVILGLVFIGFMLTGRLIQKKLAIR